MVVKNAKAAARLWVKDEASELPGFCGAFIHGSTNWLSEEAVLPATSDVDVMVVLAGHEASGRRGKFTFQGALLEVSYLPMERIQTAEQVLGDYHLAGSFHGPSVILDPSGVLTRLQTVVAKQYAQRFWVRKRCEHARSNVLNFLGALNESRPFHEQATPWLFGTGVTTHILLVAGLKNPTVRSRYLEARELLSDYGLLNFHETLLEMLGCAAMRRERAEEHLRGLAEVFDAAKAVIKTPYPFAADLTDAARPVVMDGSRDLIERGFHREAIFWMAATYLRCQGVLYRDAPAEVQERFQGGYRALLADLGIVSQEDIRHRCEAVKEFLPRVWEAAEAIMAANPGIEGKPAPAA